MRTLLALVLVVLAGCATLPPATGPPFPWTTVGELSADVLGPPARVARSDTCEGLMRLQAEGGNLAWVILVSQDAQRFVAVAFGDTGPTRVVLGWHKAGALTVHAVLPRIDEPVMDAWLCGPVRGL